MDDIILFWGCASSNVTELSQRGPAFNTFLLKRDCVLRFICPASASPSYRVRAVRYHIPGIIFIYSVEGTDHRNPFFAHISTVLLIPHHKEWTNLPPQKWCPSHRPRKDHNRHPPTTHFNKFHDVACCNYC